jgi:hypothetical protein
VRRADLPTGRRPADPGPAPDPDPARPADRCPRRGRRRARGADHCHRRGHGPRLGRHRARPRCAQRRPAPAVVLPRRPIRSEAAFAMLSGTARTPMSSGRTGRHPLNRPANASSTAPCTRSS